jgi:histidinol dehydrogenase
VIKINLSQWSGLDRKQQQKLLQRPKSGNRKLQTDVAAIVRKVRDGGDNSLLELTRQFDGNEPQCFEWDSDSMHAATQTAQAAIEGRLAQAIAEASARIRTFHAADIPFDCEVETSPGLTCEIRYQPLSPVGLYVPGGSAPLVSTVLMLAIPAELAGCGEVVMCTPPDSSGKVSPEILAAASFCAGPYPVAKRFLAPVTPG